MRTSNGSRTFDQIGYFLQDATMFIGKTWISIPIYLRILLLIVLIVAGINIVLSLIKAILNNKASWKIKQGTQLMLSFSMGSGLHQFVLIYKEAIKYLFDRKWSKVSLAGLAYRLGNLSHFSKIILFLYSLAYLPLAILGIAEMIVRFVLGSIIYHVISFAYVLILITLWILNLILIPLFNLIDRTTWVTQHCPKDYATFKLPVFECPHCGTKHSKLYPGNTGLLWTKCVCGHFIPCSVISKRNNLKPYCPKCGYALASSSVRSLTIQIIGGNSSGKTAYIAAVQHQYILSMKNIEKLSISISPVDEFRALENIYFTGITEESPRDEVRAYYILHNNKGSSDDGIVIYDVPDEIILSEQYERNPLNFAYCDGLVIIVDPLSIRAVRKECEALAGPSSTIGYSNDSAEDIIIHFINKYSEVAGRMAKKMSDIPVAVVIAKSDLTVIRQKIGYVKIKSEYAGNRGLYSSFNDARDKICRKYLSEIGLSNAINNLDSVFPHVSYFPVSSIGHKEDGTQFEPQNVLEPIAWLARQSQSNLCDLAPFVKEERQ